MDGSNWSITADINEILREKGFLTSLFRLHRSVWQLYIIYLFGQKVHYLVEKCLVEDNALGNYLFLCVYLTTSSVPSTGQKN